MKPKLINTSTRKGLKQAERLHNSGKYNPPYPLPDYSLILVFEPKSKESEVIVQHG